MKLILKTKHSTSCIRGVWNESKLIFKIKDNKEKIIRIRKKIKLILAEEN